MDWQPIIEYGSEPPGIFLLLRGWARFQINIATQDAPNMVDVDAVPGPLMVGELERPLADPSDLRRSDPRAVARAGATVLVAASHAAASYVPLLLMPYPSLQQVRGASPEVDQLLSAHIRRQTVAWHPWIGGTRRKKWRVAKWLHDDVIARGQAAVTIPKAVLGYKMLATVEPHERGRASSRPTSAAETAAGEAIRVLKGLQDDDDILTVKKREKTKSKSGYYEYEITFHTGAEARLRAILCS